MLSTRARLLFACLALLTQVAAQKPRSAAAAVAALERVLTSPEGERRRAARDLGAFAEPEASALLLRELQSAKEPAYRQDLLRAIGEQVRPGAVAAVRPVLQREDNPRLLEVAAQALARQGDDGVQALAAELTAQAQHRARRTAILGALGKSELPAARARVLQELQTAGGRDRLPALRALADVDGDAAVDAARVQLGRDADVEVASAALQQLATHAHADAPAVALDLHRRGKPLDAEAHAAVLHGLLLAPTAATFAAIVQHGALADDPFAKVRAAAWTRALGDAAFVRWLAKEGVASKALGDRAFVATVLGHLGGAPAIAALAKLLRDGGPVAAAAAQALVQLGADAAQAPLQELLTNGSDDARALALASLHELHRADAAWPPLLLPHASGTLPLTAAVALRCLAELQPPPSTALAPALASLAHKQANVRAAAIDLLTALRSKDAIAPLIERLDQEQGRLRSDVLTALSALTQQAFVDTAQWQKWWQQVGTDFVVPPPKPTAKPGARGRDARATVATYFDLAVTSERVAFVLDISGSMREPMGTGGRTRLDAAKQQLEQVVPQLPPKGKVNLIWFGSDASAFADRLVEPKRRPQLLTAAKELEARGATNVHAAMQLAFADPEVDTIYLLTDGHPSAGAIVDGTQLADEVQRWNRRRGVRIHTIALGGKSDFLERLAKDSGGDSTVAR